MSGQGSFFEPDHDVVVKPTADVARALRVLITVKAAPNPSSHYGETVCVAGVTVELDQPRWIRLYPINFRFLDQDLKFTKYDIVTVQAVPARTDQRRESWRPLMASLVVERQLPPWKPRIQVLEPFMDESMCELNRAVRLDHGARSLGLVRARAVHGIDLEPHPGWTPEERGKIDVYVNQLDLFGGDDKTALEPPRLKGYYRWQCFDPACDGHRQGILDWEFVALQRRFRHLPDAQLVAVVRGKFLDEICVPTRDVSFFVGNQAKRTNVFSILGAFWPPRI